MFQRTLAIVLCSVLVMGFSYGSRDEKKPSVASSTAAAANKVQTQTAAAYDAARSTANTAKNEVKQTVDAYAGSYGKKAVAEADVKSVQAASNAVMTAAPAAPQTTAAPAAPGQFPTKLISQLAAGDEATRKARMESLKRLSLALSQMNAQKQAQTTTAAPEKASSRKS